MNYSLFYFCLPFLSKPWHCNMPLSFTQYQMTHSWIFQTHTYTPWFCLYCTPPPQKKLVIISKTTYSLIFKNKTFLHPIIKVSVSLTEYRCLCSCDWPNTLGNNLFLFSLYFPISSASSFVSLCLCMYACLPNTKLSGYVLSKVLVVSIISSVLAGMSYPRPTGFIQND